MTLNTCTSRDSQSDTNWIIVSNVFAFSDSHLVCYLPIHIWCPETLDLPHFNIA
jgi:hypothetical protein